MPSEIAQKGAQASSRLDNRTKWISLDNYGLLEDEYTHIEEVFSKYIDLSNDLRVLHIRPVGMEEYEGVICFKKCDAEYVVLEPSGYTNEIIDSLERRNLLIRMIGH